jgi:hypothetical protein
MPTKYIIVLFSVAILIVLPPAVTRMLGEPIRTLAGLAALQSLAVLLFLFTSLISLGFCVNAMTEKKWKIAGGYGVATAIPPATCALAALTNSPGWEALMGI